MPKSNPPANERWLTQDDLAERLQVPVNTLRDWRSHGYRPTGVRFGRGRGGSVRYRLSAVEAFEREIEQAGPAWRAS